MVDFFFPHQRRLGSENLPHSSDIQCMLEIVVKCYEQPVFAKKSCCSFSAATALLAASAPHFLSVLEERCVPSSISGEVHLLTIASVVHRSI